MTGTLVILRHGQSEWNLKNLFTGWHDVALDRAGPAGGRRGRSHDERGRTAVRHVAHLAADASRRHRRTWRSMRWVSRGCRSSATGASTSGTTARCRDSTRRRRPSATAPSRSTPGAAATRRRRRPSISTAPSTPATTSGTDSCRPTSCPAAECLKDVVDRVLPYWYDRIAPQLLAGLDVLVTAHGNSLRGTAQAPRRRERRRHRRRQHPDRRTPPVHVRRPPRRAGRRVSR